VFPTETPPRGVRGQNVKEPPSRV